MSTTIIPHPSHNYNTLPDINEAHTNFPPTDTASLTTIIGQIFIKHHVQQYFGLILLHNHFQLLSYEKLVNFENVAIPYPSSPQVEQTQDIRGSAWRFVDGGIAAYEFTHGDASQRDISAYQPFLADLRAVLGALGLLEKLGVFAFSSEDVKRTAPMVEFTSGRANITLAFDVIPDEGSLLEVVWQFEEPACLERRLLMEARLRFR